jgi:hypothetical protein
MTSSPGFAGCRQRRPLRSSSRSSVDWIEGDVLFRLDDTQRRGAITFAQRIIGRARNLVLSSGHCCRSCPRASTSLFPRRFGLATFTSNILARTSKVDVSPVRRVHIHQSNGTTLRNNAMSAGNLLRSALCPRDRYGVNRYASAAQLVPCRGGYWTPVNPGMNTSAGWLSQSQSRSTIYVTALTNS